MRTVDETVSSWVTGGSPDRQAGVRNSDFYTILLPSRASSWWNQVNACASHQKHNTIWNPISISARKIARKRRLRGKRCHPLWRPPPPFTSPHWLDYFILKLLKQKQSPYLSVGKYKVDIFWIYFPTDVQMDVRISNCVFHIDVWNLVHLCSMPIQTYRN